jgi:hypothetical protein
MEKAVSPFGSIDSKRKKEILSRTDPAKDTCRDDYDSRKSYKLEGNIFKYHHGRPLPKEEAEAAIEYISIIMRRYPFQLRYNLARPLWDRFCEEWCQSGDAAKSMRAI